MLFQSFGQFYKVLGYFFLSFGLFFQSEVSSESLTPETMKNFFKNLDLSKEELPAGLDVKKVQVQVDKTDVKVSDSISVIRLDNFIPLAIFK